MSVLKVKKQTDLPSWDLYSRETVNMPPSPVYWETFESTGQKLTSYQQCKEQLLHLSLPLTHQTFPAPRLTSSPPLRGVFPRIPGSVRCVARDFRDKHKDKIQKSSFLKRLSLKSGSDDTRKYVQELPLCLSLSECTCSRKLPCVP